MTHCMYAWKPLILEIFLNGITAGRRIQKVSLKLKFLKPDLQCPDPSKECCNSPALVAKGQGLQWFCYKSCLFSLADKWSSLSRNAAKERHQAGYELGNVSSREGPRTRGYSPSRSWRWGFPGGEIYPSRVVGGEWRWNSEGILGH